MPSSAAASRIFSIGWNADPPRSTGASPPEAALAQDEGVVVGPWDDENLED